MTFLFSSERDALGDEGSMFGPKMGSWSVHSKSDPRWNSSGRGLGLANTGGPGEMQAWLAECQKKYGARPGDLTTSFYKD